MGPACGIRIASSDKTTCKRSVQGALTPAGMAQMQSKIKNCWSAYNKKVVQEADDLLYQVHGLRNMVSKIKLSEVRSDVVLIVCTPQGDIFHVFSTPWLPLLSGEALAKSFSETFACCAQCALLLWDVV